jgi:hypothetical protein
MQMQAKFMVHAISAFIALTIAVGIIGTDHLHDARFTFVSTSFVGGV